MTRPDGMVDGAPDGALAVTHDWAGRRTVHVRTKVGAAGIPGRPDLTPGTLVWHELQGTGTVAVDLPETDLAWTAWPKNEPFTPIDARSLAPALPGGGETPSGPQVNPSPLTGGLLRITALDHEGRTTDPATVLEGGYLEHAEDHQTRGGSS